MAIQKTQFNKGTITWNGYELGRTSAVLINHEPIVGKAMADEVGFLYEYSLGEVVHVNTNLYDFDSSAMLAAFQFGGGQSFYIQNMVGQIYEQKPLQFVPHESTGAGFRLETCSARWQGVMPFAADRRSYIPLIFTSHSRDGVGNLIIFDPGTQTSSQATSYRTVLIALRTKLEGMKWGTSGNTIFRQVYVTSNPTSSFLNYIRPAAAIIRDVRRTVDIQNPEFSDCVVELELISTVHSNLGEEGSLGRRGSGTTSSAGAGIIEIEDEVRKKIGYMTEDDGFSVRSIVETGTNIYAIPSNEAENVFGKKLQIRISIDVARD